MAGIGFLGAGLAQGFGQGMLQGEQLKRQKALDQTYMKHVGAQDEMMKQFREAEEARWRSQEASKTFPAPQPYTAGPSAAAEAAAQQYAHNPSGYTFQPPNQQQMQLRPAPIQGPPEAGGPTDLGTANIPQMTSVAPPQLHGPAAWAAAAPKFGQDIQEAATNWRGGQFEQQLSLAQNKLLKDMFMAQYRTGLQQTKNHDAAITHAKISFLQQAMTNKAMLPPGTTMDGLMGMLDQFALAIPGGGGPAGAMSVPPPSTRQGITIPGAPVGATTPGVNQPGMNGPLGASQRPASGKQVDDLANLDTAIDQIGALARAASKKNAPYSGWGAEALQKFETGAPKSIQDMLPGNVPEREAYYSQIKSSQIQGLRSLFKGRVTNVDLLIGQAMEPALGDSNEVIKSKLNAIYSRAQAMREVLRRHMEQGGFQTPGPMDENEVMQAESVLGRNGPASPGPTGAGNGLPPGAIPMPQIRRP